MLNNNFFIYLYFLKTNMRRRRYTFTPGCKNKNTPGSSAISA